MAAARGAPHGTLPPTVLRLIPRDQEEHDISWALLEPSTRVLSLVGPPRAGKTRPAVCVAARLSANFEDGVTFVDLSVVSDASNMPSAIAAAIGMREVIGERVGDRLALLLRRRRALLVLDNFEHLLSAASFVAELVASCRSLTILTTTREALHLSDRHDRRGHDHAGRQDPREAAHERNRTGQHAEGDQRSGRGIYLATQNTYRNGSDPRP